ncbi:7145_t:CDS:2 [Cetraspora pellucida]|uniref:7145_t:CDS:1 n=1 Tax=Cetraspora pellucida TaxID=1433469 RepID=A0A9N9D1X6_9GLOM|nr:7145_t:CDS:2 [Cetraspora pellucida]
MTVCNQLEYIIMLASTSKNDDISIEIKSEVKEMKPTKYFAINPEGEFVVEFVVKENFEFELQLYNVDLDYNLKLENTPDLFNQETSYRKLSPLPKVFSFTKTDQENQELTTSPTQFSFIDTNLEAIKNTNILRWSVSVSDKSTNVSEFREFRLLAISCISLEDMDYYTKDSSERDTTETQNKGFTFVFIIVKLEENYLIRNDKMLSLEYGGIVRLFSNNDNNKKKGSKRPDEGFIIILTLSGICKYHLKMRNIYININDTQKLKYPKRIYNAINNNIFFEDQDRSAYNLTCAYIESCLNKHYFLVDTIKDEIGYIELYDLKTNQLVNIFQRKILNKWILLDHPTSSYAISNNNKLLAYVSSSIKGIEIYSIECGLKIADIANLYTSDKKIYNKTDDKADERTDEETDDVKIFIDFFHNDEMLFIYLSEDKWTVWNIFGSLRASVKLEKPGFAMKLPLVEFGDHYKIKKSNSFMIVNQDDKLVVYDDYIIDKYFKCYKGNNKQNWKSLSNEYLLKNDFNNKVRDLNDNESNLDKNYKILEPWLLDSCGYSQYSFYLGEKKKGQNDRLLLIGNHTIQVWYIQDKKRSLEFIHVPLSHARSFDMHKISEKELRGWELQAIKVNDFNYWTGKFKLRIQNIEDPHQIKIDEIKMEDDEDFLNVPIYACYAFKYLSAYKKVEWHLSKDRKLKFSRILNHTRRIILRFVRLHPTTWRLLDVRHDLMNVLIETRDYELVNDILSYGKSTHIPQHLPWSGKKNPIHTALSDPTMLALFLEYYSNNATNNIGWMNTVVGIIPELYSNKEMNKKEDGNIYCIRMKLICKQLDLFSFEYIEIPPELDGLLKVYVPITQLIPQDSKLSLKEIASDKAGDIRVVPLPNFTTTERMLSDVRRINRTIIQKLIVLPKYLYFKDEDYSPFIRIIKKVDLDILCENPSLGAVINWMWYSSKSYWSRTLYSFILYFLIYSIISWAYIAHLQITGALQHFPIMTIIVLFYYLSYNHIAIELSQLYHNKKYFSDLFNLVDLSSLIIPICIFSYILINYYTFDSGFKNAESSETTEDGPFSNIVSAILAVYDWSSISLDAWNFWPLTLISVIGNAVKNSRRIYGYQIDFIYDFALLDRSLEFNELDSKFTDKLNIKYICFNDDPSITDSWKEKSEQEKSKPYPNFPKLHRSGIESWLTESCLFIWERKEETLDIKFWFD